MKRRKGWLLGWITRCLGIRLSDLVGRGGYEFGGGRADAGFAQNGNDAKSGGCRASLSVALWSL